MLERICVMSRSSGLALSATWPRTRRAGGSHRRASSPSLARLPVSTLPGCHASRGPGAAAANLPPLAPLGRGEAHAHDILLQQIDGYGEKNYILHEERNVTSHCWKPTRGRSPAIRHQWDNGDGGYE